MMWSVPLIIIFVTTVHIKFGSSHNISHFSIDEITSLFGDKECIEGSLVEFQPPSARAPTVFAYEDLQVMLKKVGGKIAQGWTPPVSDIYSSFTSRVNTESKPKKESTTKSTTSEYSAVNFNGKTPRSVVNELSLLTKVRPEYYLIDERGPPHEKSFTVSLKFGSEEYTATGPSINKARHFAANKLLQDTRYQQPLQQMAHKQQMRIKNVGSKTATSIVYEIAAKRKLSLSFEVESQTGPPHMPTFVTRCALGDKISRGQGSSKKLSKRAAAEEMLELLQYNESYSFLPKSMVGKSRKKRNSSRKKKGIPRRILDTFQQVNPGVHTDENIAAIMNSQFWDVSNGISKGLNERLTAFAKQLVKSSSSFLGEAFVESTLKDTSSSFSSRSQTSKDQKVTARDTLTQAADLLDFKFHFTDLPKSNDEFLSLVSLTTNQPSLCLGVGPTLEASQEQAALRALKALWKLDMEQISSNTAPNKKSGGGDWLHWSEEMIQNAKDAFHMK